MIADESRETMSTAIVQLGYACCIAASGYALRDIGVLFSSETLSLADIAFGPHVGVMLTLLIVSILCLAKRTRMLEVPWAVAFGVMVVCALSGMGICAATPDVPWWLVLLCGLVLGAGEAIGYLVWMSALMHEGGRARAEILSGSLLACLLQLAVAALDEQAAVFACVGLEVMSAACLVATMMFQRRSAFLPEGYSTSYHNRWDQGGRMAPVWASFRVLWRPAVFVGAMGFMVTALRSTVDSSNLTTISVLTAIGTIIACFGLIVFFLRARSQLSLNNIYLVLFPVNALVFLLVAILGSAQGLFLMVVAVITSFSFHLCSILVAVQAPEYAEVIGVPSFAAYGIVAGLFHIVLFIGYPMSFMGIDTMGYAGIPVVASVVVYVGSRTHCEFCRFEESRDSA